MVSLPPRHCHSPYRTHRIPLTRRQASSSFLRECRTFVFCPRPKTAVAGAAAWALGEKKKAKISKNRQIQAKITQKTRKKQRKTKKMIKK
jgi:hypothetical protein